MSAALLAFSAEARRMSLLSADAADHVDVLLPGTAFFVGMAPCDVRNKFGAPRAGGEVLVVIVVVALLFIALTSPW